MTPTGPPPLVGVTTYRQVTSWWAWERDAALVPGAYLDMVEAAGGQPVLIPAPAEGAAGAGPGSERVGALVATLDGLLLIGGGDLDAGRYGQVPDPRNGGINRRRDDLELALLGAALDRDLPVLAVCRGLQLLNVALGGDLVQHLPDVLGSTHHQPRPGAFGTVAIVTEENSTVRRVLGDRADVLCSHHQGVGRLGEDLAVTARSDDGIVEAVELPGRRFVVGVQWHPEETGDTRLFRALVEAAGRRPAPAPSQGTAPTVVNANEGAQHR
ncbi:MAG: gamma-glutamyl-gamma-aminobutyrate hydrolase family protein [Acidimicrobiales bacterium]